jgi:hypothetical protein
MNPLRARLLALALFTAAAGPAPAQVTYANPGLYSLGHGLPVGGSWGLRSDYSPGLKWKGPESRLDAGFPADINRASLYADWFPFGSGFRVVGGLNFNDTRNAQVNPLGYTATAAGSPYQLRPRSPNTSTYVGVGYGQQGQAGKGLGFYADMGVSLGALPSETDIGQGSNATLDMDGWRTQSNGWLGFRYLPSVSLGLIYRY